MARAARTKTDSPQHRLAARRSIGDLSGAQIAEIGRRAALALQAEIRAAGLPLASVEDGWAVEIRPDGSRRRVESVES